MTPGPPHQLTATDDDAAGAVSSACARARTHTAAPSEPIFVVAVFLYVRVCVLDTPQLIYNDRKRNGENVYLSILVYVGSIDN